MDSTPPLLSTVSDGVATLTFNRPDSLNALNLATKEALLHALGEAGTDDAVRVVVLTGSARAFCVGQDLKEHIGAISTGDTEAVWRTVPDHFNPIATLIAEMDKPVIAAVNGVAAGAGASLAFLADYRLVAESAGFNLAFAQIALSCDTGSSWTLPRLVGPTRAMDLLLNPRTITSADALDWGIASEVVADDAFAGRLAELAGTLANGPTAAYAAMRHSVRNAASSDLAGALAYEAEMMRRTGASADHQAAVEAFLAKQRPSFTGR